MKTSKKQPSLLEEQLALQELPPGEENRWNEAEKDLIKKQIQGSNQEILAQYPPEEFLSRLGARSQKTKKPRRLWLSLGPIAAAALLILTFFPWQNLFQTSDPLSTDLERLKGAEPRLLVYKRDLETIISLENGAAAQAGDQLQLGIWLPLPQHAALLSLDGQDVLTQHWPEKGLRSILVPQGEFLLPFSYILDTAPGFERFYLVLSEAPFTLGAVKARILASTSPSVDLGPEITLLTLELKKERQP